jgi:hypothetical protein
MLATFGTLCKALEFAYPEGDWCEKKFWFKGKKSSQRFLIIFMLLVFSCILIPLQGDSTWLSSSASDLLFSLLILSSEAGLSSKFFCSPYKLTSPSVLSEFLLTN